MSAVLTRQTPGGNFVFQRSIHFAAVASQGEILFSILEGSRAFFFLSEGADYTLAAMDHAPFGAQGV